MSDLSLETRASSAYVQGRLEAIIGRHWLHSVAACNCMRRVAAIVLEWKQAENELAAAKAFMEGEGK